MVQGATNKPKTKENQLLNPWDAATIAAYFKDSMTNGKIEMDELEKPLVYPTFLIDPQANPIKFLGSANPLRIQLVDGITPSTIAGVSTPQLQALLSGGALLTNAIQYVWNNANTQEEIIRTPTIWKGLIMTASGSNALWTPVAGKKFRLMGVSFMLSKEAACAGQFFANLLDSATDMKIYFNVSSVALTAIGNVVTLVLDFKPNGYLSAAVNNVLNVNLNGTLTAGNLAVNAWGTEE